MIKERALIKDMMVLLESTDMSPLQRQSDNLVGRAIEILTQPEQEVKVGIYDDIFSDYEYLVTAFKNGANADDYSSDIGRAFSDIRKARNWLCPLPKHVID